MLMRLAFLVGRRIVNAPISFVLSSSGRCAATWFRDLSWPAPEPRA
jgi:hypothetical protein